MKRHPVGPAIAAGVADLARQWRSACWIGVATVLAAFVASRPTVGVATRLLSDSATGLEHLESFSPDGIGDLLANHAPELGVALGTIPLLLPFLFVGVLLAGIGFLSQAFGKTESKSLDGLVVAGMRGFWKSSAAFLTLAFGATIAAGLFGAAVPPLSNWLELELMDDRFAEAYFAGLTLIVVVAAMLVRSAWDLARYEIVSSEANGWVAAWRGAVSTARDPIGALSLQAFFAGVAILIVSVSFVAALLVDARNSGMVSLQWVLLAIGAFLAPWARMAGLASMARWRASWPVPVVELVPAPIEAAPAPEPGVVDSTDPPVDTDDDDPPVFAIAFGTDAENLRNDRAPREAPSLEPEETAAAASTSPVGDETPGSSRIEREVFDLPPAPGEPKHIRPPARPSKDVTLPIPIDAFRLRVARQFPANLPKGLGVEVMRSSALSGPTLPPGWVPGDPIGDESIELPPQDEVKTKPIPTSVVRRARSAPASAGPPARVDPLETTLPLRRPTAEELATEPREQASSSRSDESPAVTPDSSKAAGERSEKPDEE